MRKKTITIHCRALIKLSNQKTSIDIGKEMVALMRCQRFIITLKTRCVVGMPQRVILVTLNSSPSLKDLNPSTTALEVSKSSSSITNQASLE